MNLSHKHKNRFIFPCMFLHVYVLYVVVVTTYIFLLFCSANMMIFHEIIRF